MAEDSQSQGRYHCQEENKSPMSYLSWRYVGQNEYLYCGCQVRVNPGGKVLRNLLWEITDEVFIVISEIRQLGIFIIHCSVEINNINIHFQESAAMSNFIAYRWSELNKCMLKRIGSSSTSSNGAIRLKVFCPQW